MRHRCFRGIIALTCCLLVSLVISSCDKEKRCGVPIGDATCQIDPNSPLYPGLNVVGGFEYIVGGNNGIAVIRLSMSEFAAYERTCPHDTCRLEAPEEYAGLVLQCPQCGSQFSTFGDGVPLESSQTSCALYQYSTYYDGRTLYISN